MIAEEPHVNHVPINGDLLSETFRASEERHESLVPSTSKHKLEVIISLVAQEAENNRDRKEDGLADLKTNPNAPPHGCAD